jgi:cytochrome c
MIDLKNKMKKITQSNPLMNRTAAVALLFTLLAACAPPKETVKEDYGTPQATTGGMSITAADLIAQGESLVKASDCKTCHHITNKLIGPSHTDVAKKYAFTQANVAYLAGKIIAGGSGVWGEVPMTAHPEISRPDAEKMARYVLSLDGETEQ